jgi:hypothetical protein
MRLDLNSNICVKILNAYNEYVHYKYPSDPNIYFVKGHPNTISDLKEYCKLNIHNPSPIVDNLNIMGFGVIEDLSLGPEEIIFGPEQVKLIWNRG